MLRHLPGIFAICLSAPLAAQEPVSGDAAAGKAGFNRCRSCHTLVTDTGDVVQRGGRAGPNLWGVIGRQAGTVKEFRYGQDLVAAGEAGLIWDQDNIVAFTADPRQFLRDFLGDKSARTNMAFRQKKGIEDIAAYLSSIGPAPDVAEDAEAGEILQ